MKQIYIDRNNYSCLKGKVVDKVAVNFDVADYSEAHLVITFTDNTFIRIGLTETDCELDMYEKPVLDPSCYYDIVGAASYLDNENNLRLKPFAQQLVDLGIWTLSEEKLMEIKKGKITLKEENEYKEYLRLKEKYEPSSRKPND